MTFPNRLVDGYRTFLGGRLRKEQDHYRKLAEKGQAPPVMIVGCCDSRVSPEVIFDADPGELFVVRNVANLVPPYDPDGKAHGVSAALEFAVVALKVKHIVVLGHAQCGGVKACAEQAAPLSDTDFIGKWVSLIAPAVETVGPQGQQSKDEYLTKVEQANIAHSLENLMTFPQLRGPIERGELSIHGAYFGVATGKLSVFDGKAKEFKQVATEDYSRLFATPRF